MSSLKRRVFYGLSSVFILRIFSQIISFSRLIFVARLLSPADFGIFGAATLLLTITEIFTETGVSVFLMQQPAEKTEEYLSSVWWIQTIRGVLISLCLFLLSPVVISFFSLQNAGFVFFLVSLIPLVKGLSNPALLLLQKNLQFKKEATLEGISIFVGSISMVLVAAVTHSPTALAIGLLTETIIGMLLSFIAISSHPQLTYQKEKISQVLHHGKWLTVISITNYLFHNFDDWVVGRLFGASSLGLYQMAYKIGMLPINEGADVLSRVLFPAFSLVSTKLDVLKKTFWQVTIFLCISCSIFLTISFLYGQQIITFLLGENWVSITQIVQTLVIFGSIRAISGFNATLLYVRSKQKEVSLVTTLSMIGLLVTIFPLTHAYGVIGAAYASIVGAVISAPLMYYFVYKMFSE